MSGKDGGELELVFH